MNSTRPSYSITHIYTAIKLQFIYIISVSKTKISTKTKRNLPAYQIMMQLEI